MSAPAVGIVLAPEPAWLGHLAGVLDGLVDLYEVTPETLWRRGRDGLARNDYGHLFASLVGSGRPFVAHGVGFGLGEDDPGDADRTARWLAMLARDHATFGFRWLTDHLGATSAGGEHTALPLPIPYDDAHLDVVGRRLDRLATVVPDVGVENTCHYLLLDDPLDEPAFLARLLDRPGRWLLLDLHNLWTMSVNLGFDAEAWLARAPLHRVREIHVSGGRAADPSWLPTSRPFRLDSHDDAVPDAVWDLLAAVRPRCPELGAVVLERMEGTVGHEDVDLVAAELERIRRGIA